MITKRNLIETLQNRLVGGDCPDDLKGMYPVQILEQIVQGVLSDLLARSPMMMKQLGVAYTVTPTQNEKTKQWSAVLPVTPLQGSQSILYAYGCGESDWYTIVQGRYNNYIMSILKPSRCRIGTYYEDGSLVFTSEPYSTVTAYLVPNVADMPDDEELILPGSESLLFDACFKQIKSMGINPMEIINNTKIDGAAQ